MILNLQKRSAERLDPLNYVFGGEDGYYGNAAHIKRYQFAANNLLNKGLVIDAACGTGYGSKILSQKNLFVIAIDIAKEAIEYAKENYQQDNIKFICSDVYTIDQKSNTVDAVVSFETIEHLENPERFLQEIVRILKEKGELIISTPFRLITTKTPENPHHLIEYGVNEFKQLLKSKFKYVKIYSEFRNESFLKSFLKRVDYFNLRKLIKSKLIEQTQPSSEQIVENVDPTKLQIALSNTNISISPISTLQCATIAVCRNKIDNNIKQDK